MAKPQRWRVLISLFAGTFAGQAAVHAANPPETPASLPPAVSRRVDFATDIKPLFEAACVQCHAKGKDKGGLSLETRDAFLRGGNTGPAAVIGKSEESLAVKLVAGLDPESVMPKKGTKWTAQQVGLLRSWIDQGAAWDASITFSRPESANLRPHTVVASAGSGNPLDALLEQAVSRQGGKLGDAIDDRGYCRRVHLDIVGLLPDPDELDSFVADRSTDKRTSLVRRLLADRRGYADHWMTFWNDLLRNDYKGTGYIDGGRKQITGWLYKSLAENRPYDHFVAELVNPQPGSEGFAKGIVWRGTTNASMTPPMQAAQNVSQVFLGVNLKCASCHDSFVSDWTLADAYGLAAIYSDAPLELVHCDKPTGKQSVARFLYPQLGEIDGKAPRSVRLKQLADLMISPTDGRLPRTIVNRLWQKLLGRGLVEPVDDMEKTAWSPEMLDWLAEDLVAHQWDLKRTIEMITTSRAYQLPVVENQPKGDYVFRGPLARRLTAEQFCDALSTLTDNWTKTPSSKEIDFKGLGFKPERIRASLVSADPLQTALDRPNREQVMTVRSTAATTLQALELTNGASFDGRVRAGAAKMVAAASKDPSGWIIHTWKHATGRVPSEAELQVARELLGKPVSPDSVADFLWTMTLLPEFQFVN